MSKIYRYEVPIDDEWHEVPKGKVVFATKYRRLDRNRVEVWVQLANPHSPLPPKMMALRIYGTGQEIPDEAEHVASVQDDPFIWHILSLPGSTR